MNEEASRRTCSLCYKRIQPEGSWLEGHNAAPVGVADPHAHKSLVKHNRCCAVCNFGIVLPIRIMAANGNGKVMDLLRPLSNAKNQSEVIVAHMNLFMALGAFGMNGGVN